MHECHRRTIDRWKERFAADERFLALVVVGSVARDDASERSDVDFVLVASDVEYARRRANNSLFITAADLPGHNDREGGGYTVDLQYLLDAAERGDERTRFQFVKARIAFSRVAGLEQIAARIATYPERERLQKMSSFLSQLPLHFSFMELADHSRNAYLLAETAVDLVMFGGRLILAHNRRLYPGRKLFMREFENAPDKPAGIIDLATRLLRQPGIANAKAFCDSIAGHTRWPEPEEGRWQRIHKDSVWNWRDGRLSPGDW